MPFVSPKEFKPTTAMELVAYQRAKAGEYVAQYKVAEAAGVHASVVSSWNSKPGFAEWFAMRVQYYRTDITELLDAIAKKNIDKDYRFWEALALKYNYISKDPGVSATAPNDRERISSAEYLKLVVRDKPVEPTG